MIRNTMKDAVVDRGRLTSDAASVRPPSRALSKLLEALVRFEPFAPLYAAIVTALPAAIAAYPPMTDLPLHEANVSLVRHFADPRMVPPGLYLLNFGHPNQLFHALATSLSFLFSVRMAVRIVVTAIMLAIPLAAGRLARHVGASRWTAAAVAPIALGWLLFMGLVANLLGLALLLALLPTLDDFVEAPTWKGLAKSFGAAVCLYFGHEAMLFVFTGALVVFTIGKPFRPRSMAFCAGLFASCVAIVVAHLLRQASLFNATSDPHAVLWMPVLLKFKGIAGSLFGAYDLAESHLLFGVIAAFAALAAIDTWKGQPQSSAERVTFRAFVHEHRFGWVAACCAVAYLVYPLGMVGATLVYQRFLFPSVAIALVLSLRARGFDQARTAGRWRRGALVLAAIIPLLSLLVVWPAFAESDRNYRDISKLIERMDEGGSVACFSSQTYGEHGFVRATVCNLAIAEKGGRMLSSLADSPIAPALLNRRYDWPDPTERISTNAMKICPSYDLTRVRYVFLYTQDVRFEVTFRAALEPEARLVGTAGNWALYESTLKTVPLTSTDDHPPATCTDTLEARIRGAATP